MAFPLLDDFDKFEATYLAGDGLGGNFDVWSRLSNDVVEPCRLNGVEVVDEVEVVAVGEKYFSTTLGSP